jgi:ribosomal protein S27E
MKTRIIEGVKITRHRTKFGIFETKCLIVITFDLNGKFLIVACMPCGIGMWLYSTASRNPGYQDAT